MSVLVVLEQSGGVFHRMGWEAVVAAKEFGLPVAVAYRRRDLMDAAHPCFVGEIGIGVAPALAKAVAESDLILAVGIRLGELNTIGGGYPQVAAVSIFGASGMLLANSLYYPAPYASIANRDDFAGIREYLRAHDIEGIVWHRANGDMVKIKKKDFGLPRRPQGSGM